MSSGFYPTQRTVSPKVRRFGSCPPGSTSDLQGSLPLTPPQAPPAATVLQPKCLVVDGTKRTRWEQLGLVSQVDLEIRIIPDIVILPVAALGLPLMIVFGSAPWWQWPVAGLGAAGFLFLISEVYYRIRHAEGMGFGDVKLALCMGVYLGPAVVPALFLGFIGGAAVGVILIGGRRGDGKTAIPFGPFLAAGAILALFFGGALIDAYLGLVFPS
jgi:prepilin signal peptidase PulO-like enzyme (type II secretory pathway)